MDISNHPQLIRELSEDILSIEAELQSVQRERMQIDVAIDQDILGNKELKNEAQRKAAGSTERLTHDRYQELTQAIERLQQHIAQRRVSRQFYRDEIEVAKILATRP